MSFNLSNVKWGWVALGVVVAFAIAYGSSICVVAGYSLILSFQSMGPPDQTMINEFAANAAPGVVGVLIGVGTLVGGLLAGRKAKADALQNSLAVGSITALIRFVISPLGGFSLWTAVGVVLAVGGGWVGGQLDNKKA